MAVSAKQAVEDICAHIKKQGGQYSSWYCGVTSDLNTRVHGDHNVPKEKHWYIPRRCHSDDDARSAEKAMLTFGCDGGTGGGDEDAVFVYAYLKTSITDP